MKVKILLCLLVFPIVSLAQNRRLLVGQVVADSIDVENITVANMSADIVTVTNIRGEFSIYAKEKDTLIFSGLLFNPRNLILRESDLSGELFEVKLDGNINLLDEVVIYRVKLTGDLAADSRRIVTTPSPTFPSSAKLVIDRYKGANAIENIAMPSNESTLQGMDLLEIGSMLAGIFGKSKKKEPMQEYSTELFADIARRKFSDYFFTNTLQINEDDIGLFLAFCDTPEARVLTGPDKAIELTDYMIKMGEKFHAMNTKE